LLNEAQINKIRQEGYNLVCADAQNFKLDGRFQAIVAGDVIEHLEDPKGFLTCVRNHLDSGGVFLVTTLNPWFFLRFVASFHGDGGVHTEHTMWYCMNTLIEMLKRNNFFIEKIEFGSMESIFAVAKKA
jgi:2-polyprenyl-3-methyl-5-hydroxy-6-metoxy-1,4-benzoquinol methylase